MKMYLLQFKGVRCRREYARFLRFLRRMEKDGKLIRLRGAVIVADRDVLRETVEATVKAFGQFKIVFLENYFKK